MLKICKNGKVSVMTEEQYAEYLALQDASNHEPTPEERIALLEADNAALKEALEMLLSGVTTDE